MARILIIDDSELILQMLNMVCQGAGHETACCATFGAVDAALAQGPPDLIITDLNLPDVPGGDPVAALRAHDTLRPRPIIIISGQPEAALQAEAQRRGADAALSKDAGLPGIMAALPPMIERLV